jgi:hypothetical protein
MERQQEINKLVHDVRGNLHASQMAVQLLESEAVSERQQQFLTALKQELTHAKENLELLVTAARSSDS